ncbi:MAG: threonine/serine exporter family protein, partial [Bifidobacteriales bacterium]|nr:threonine/serine exporter family protein [Bifidobacteriales bacterium]
HHDPRRTEAGARRVSKYHTHSIPLDMEDIERDYDKPILDACIAAKTSLIVRVGMLELGAGTGSFRVRQMMHRIAYPMGVHVRADVNLTDIEASCTDGVSRITEVVDLPTTGVNTERIWLLEHFADWLSVNCGQSSTYHAMPSVSEELVDNLDDPHVYAVARKALKDLLAHDAAAVEALKETTAEAVENLDQIEQIRLEAAQMDTMTAVGLGAVGNQAASSLDGGDGAAEITAEHIEREESSGVEPVAADRGITVRQAHERLNLIERRKPLYSPIFSGFAAAVACAAFVFLLGGGPYDMAGAFVGAGIGQWFRRQMLDRRINQFFATGASVIIAALACIATLRLVGFFDPV